MLITTESSLCGMILNDMLKNTLLHIFNFSLISFKELEQIYVEKTGFEPILRLFDRETFENNLKR